jgi:uncharacterized membrane protein YbhN (UPF0104 family)
LEEAPQRRPKGAYARLAGAAVGLLILVALIVMSHPVQVQALLARVGPAEVAGAFLLNVPVLLLRSWRACAVLRQLGHRVPPRRMLAVQLIGQTSSSLTPAASGDFARAYFWKRDEGIPLRVGAAAVAFERVYSFLLMVAVAVLLVFLPRHGLWGWAAAAACLLAVAAVPLAAPRTPAPLERAFLAGLARLPLVGGLGGRLLAAVDQLRDASRSPSLLARASAATLAIFALSGLQIWLLLLGLGHRVPITQSVAVYAVSQVGGTISMLPFGLGPADVLVVSAFTGYGVDLSTAASLAILLRAVATVPLALASVPAYLLVAHRPEGRRAAPVRRAAEAE